MKNYDVSKRNIYIMSLDANNLYGWKMSQPLPTSNFKWLTDKEMKDLDMMMMPDDSSRGYILERDLGKYYFYYLSIYVYFIKCNFSFLCISVHPRDFVKCNVSFLSISEYPHERYDLHKVYLLAPERLQIEANILNDYEHHFLQDEGFSKTSTQAPPEFMQQIELHHPLPKLYLELGLRLTNVHRVLSFNQSPWLKNYINFKTRQRTASKNDFEKDFFKLMNNAVFGEYFICLFVLLCSYILTDSLQVKFFSLCLFVHLYQFIH